MPTLSKSFCIEVLGRRSQTIIEQGTKIPTQRRVSFSTADEGQNVIEIHVLQRHPDAGMGDELYAKYLVHEVPAGPKGTTKVEVHFDVDLAENLFLKAFDIETGNALPVTLP